MGTHTCQQLKIIAYSRYVLDVVPNSNFEYFAALLFLYLAHGTNKNIQFTQAKQKHRLQESNSQLPYKLAMR